MKTSLKLDKFFFCEFCQHKNIDKTAKYTWVYKNYYVITLEQ